jgi:hypothetical protein
MDCGDETIYRAVGFARSLLAYELPDGRLKLLGGHLRRDLDPDTEVDVEVLDVTEDETRKLLLTIDPLAALALIQERIHCLGRWNPQDVSVPGFVCRGFLGFLKFPLNSCR